MDRLTSLLSAVAGYLTLLWDRVNGWWVQISNRRRVVQALLSPAEQLTLGRPRWNQAISLLFAILGAAVAVLDVTDVRSDGILLKPPSRWGILGLVVSGLSLIVIKFFWERSPLQTVPAAIRNAYAVLPCTGLPGWLELARLRPPQSSEAAQFQRIIGVHGVASWSPLLARSLAAGADVRLERSGTFVPSVSESFSLPELRRIAVIRVLDTGRIVENSPKVRLSDDPTMALLTQTAGNTIRVEKTDYITMLATDELTLHRVWRNDNKNERSQVYDGLSLFADKCTRRLLPLGTQNGSRASMAANVIGVSALVVTKDGWAILTRQSVRNVQSPGLLAPSGSGSVEWDDLEELGNNATLVCLTEAAARRETLEELGLKRPKMGTAAEWRDKLRLTPIGFARLLSRAGKPEFFFFGRLDATWENYELARRLVPGEEPFTDANLRSSIRMGNGNLTQDSVAGWVGEFRKQNKFEFSIPLEVLLECLRAACDDQAGCKRVLSLL